jgi:LmbE family N-acetylglucosaminyl deacetylase
MNSVTVENLTDGKSVLIMAPHPDDEVLGCGGLIAMCRAYGIGVKIIVMTDGRHSHILNTDGQFALAKVRRQETLASAQVLGLSHGDVVFGDIEDGQLGFNRTDTDRLMEMVRGICSQFSISSIFATSARDQHHDHKLSWELAATLRNQVSRIIGYPVGTRIDSDDPHLNDFSILETEFVAPRKRAAISCHQSQISGLEGADGFSLDANIIEKFATQPEYFEICHA